MYTVHGIKQKHDKQTKAFLEITFLLYEEPMENV